jgi:hypothetical protein
MKKEINNSNNTTSSQLSITRDDVQTPSDTPPSIFQSHALPGSQHNKYHQSQQTNQSLVNISRLSRDYEESIPNVGSGYKKL